MTQKVRKGVGCSSAIVITHGGSRERKTRREGGREDRNRVGQGQAVGICKETERKTVGTRYKFT